MKRVVWVWVVLLPLGAEAAKRVAKPFKPINPFGRRTRAGSRRDAQPGYLLLSNGQEFPGKIYLTRDKKLMVTLEADDTHERVPWGSVRRIDCFVAEDHLEREWRWKENASDVKVYTGRAYPWRLYTHTITLRDRRTVKGKMDAVIYVTVEGETKRRRFLTHKRDKGTWGDKPKDLVYVRKVVLGEAALKGALKRREVRLKREAEAKANPPADKPAEAPAATQAAVPTSTSGGSPEGTQQEK